MFERKINKMFKSLPNAFGKADDILIVQYDADGRGQSRTLRQMMYRWHWENFKLYKINAIVVSEFLI